jgi:signal transduction histidine kinase
MTSPFAAALREARGLLASTAPTAPGEAPVATRVLRELDDAIARLGGRESDRDLLSIVCHDLKEPLASIVMGAGFLRRTVPATEAAALRVIEAVARSAERMTQIVSDFHDLAKLETHSLEVDVRPQDLVATVAAAIGSLEPGARHKGLTLDLEAPESLQARCDGPRVAQIVSKLVGNAIKFTPAGGRVVVRVAPDATRARVRVTVEDTGCGIPPERIATLFDHAANARRASREGPGLGLPIVRGLTDVQEGKVAVESRVGQGTTVTVTLPAA